MDNRKTDKYYAAIIEDDIEKIFGYAEGVAYEDFIHDDQLIDAILFRLIQMTENIKKLSSTFKEKNDSIKWNEIVGFRNRIVHDYGSTDYSVVYEIVSNDLQKLKDCLIKNG